MLGENEMKPNAGVPQNVRLSEVLGRARPLAAGIAVARNGALTRGWGGEKKANAVLRTRKSAASDGLSVGHEAPSDWT